MKKYGKLFAGLIVFYLILMFGTTRIGGEQLEKNVNASLEYLEEEGEYPKPLFQSTSGRLDNFTDKIIPVSYTHLDVYKRQV